MSSIYTTRIYILVEERVVVNYARQEMTRGEIIGIYFNETNSECARCLEAVIVIVTRHKMIEESFTTSSPTIFTSILLPC